MQDRNAEMVENLVQDFTTRDEYAQSGARMSDAMKWQNRDGGGGLMFGFTGQGTQALGNAAAIGWTEASIGYANYASVTGRGGPYCVFDGTAAADYLVIGNAAWQDTAGLSLLVWAWVDVDTMLGSDMTVMAQYNGGNECSWWLRLNVTSSVFELVCNPNGIQANDVVSSSTVTVGTSGFYFVAAHFEPSTSVTFGVAAASAHTLADGLNTVTASIPALLDPSVSDLTIGAIDAGPPLTNWWDGYIGGGLGRVNVPVTNIASHMARLYGATYWLYGG